MTGWKYKTQPGKMVLEAAIDAGVYVPYSLLPLRHETLCRLPDVRGGRGKRTGPGIPGGFPAACTLAATDGMTDVE